jgi:hypothetical protein
LTAGGTLTAQYVESKGNSSKDVTLKTTSGDILVDYIESQDDVNLQSAGAIEETGIDAGNDIDAKHLIFTAQSGVGHLNTLETAVNDVTGTNVTNDINLVNDGGLVVNQVTNTNGNIDIQANSPLTVNQAVTAGGTIDLTSTGNDNLTVNADVQSTGGGKLTFNAGEDFQQNSGLIKTSGEVEINALQDDAKQSGGSIEASLLDVNVQNVIDLQSAANDVDTLEAYSDQIGDISYKDIDDVILANVTNNNGSIDVEAGGTITADNVNSSNTDDGTNDIELWTSNAG